MRNSGTQTAYIRDITVALRIMAGTMQAPYAFDDVTRRSCAGIPMPGNSAGPQPEVVPASEPHTTPGGQSTLRLSFRTPLVGGQLQGTLTLSHAADTEPVGNTRVFPLSVRPGVSGLCTVEPPTGMPGDLVLLRGYILSQGGVNMPPARFGRLAAEVIRAGTNELQVRVPAMTCAGTGTPVRAGTQNVATAASRTITFTLRQPQTCPAPVFVSVAPATVARGGTVTLNVSNIGPMDPNVYLTQAFDPADSRGSGTSRPAPVGIAEVRQNQVVVTIASGPTAWWGKATLTVSNAHGAATSTPITITP